MTATTLFDEGLQPERTHLAWRRTALSVTVGSLISLRILPAVFDSALWILPGVAGVGFAAWMWLVGHHRHRTLTRAHHTGDPNPPTLGGAHLLALTLFATVVGVIGAGVIGAGVFGAGGVP